MGPCQVGRDEGDSCGAVRESQGGGSSQRRIRGRSFILGGDLRRMKDTRPGAPSGTGPPEQAEKPALPSPSEYPPSVQRYELPFERFGLERSEACGEELGRHAPPSIQRRPATRARALSSELSSPSLLDKGLPWKMTPLGQLHSRIGSQSSSARRRPDRHQASPSRTSRSSTSSDEMRTIGRPLPGWVLAPT